MGGRNFNFINLYTIAKQNGVAERSRALQPSVRNFYEWKEIRNEGEEERKMGKDSTS